MSRFWEIVFCVPLLFSPPCLFVPLTAPKTVFSHLKKIETTMRRNCISKALHFLQIRAEHQDCPVFTYRISIHKNFIPKHLDNALTDFALTSRTVEEKAPANNFRRRVPSAEKYGCWKNWKQLHDNLRKAQRITRDHQSVYYIKENLLYIHR